MKIAIVGAGAMGSMTGGLLKEAGADVHLYDIDKRHILKIKEEGLVIEGLGGTRTIDISATSDIAEIGSVDWIAFFVKSYDTRDSAMAAKKIACENTSVLTLQNGLGNIEILEEAFGREKVVAGTTDAAATIVAPGRVKHTASGSVYLGEIDGTESRRIKEIVDIFGKAGFKAYASQNVLGIIWTKLIMNLAINPLGTILGVRCEKLIDNDHTKRVMRQVVEEALQIVQRKGIELLYPDMVQAAYELAEKNASSYNSMCQDFQRGRKTEIDFIGGAIIREGKKHGVETPVNDVLTELVKALELGRPTQT